MYFQRNDTVVDFVLAFSITVYNMSYPSYAAVSRHSVCSQQALRNFTNLVHHPHKINSYAVVQ